MAHQPIKRAIAYSAVIGTLLSGHYAIATETESVALSAPETENTVLVPVNNEAMPAPAIVVMDAPQLTELAVRTKLQSWLPVGYKPSYLTQLVKMYQANNLALIWQDEKIVQQLQQQIAEVAISGIQPQFGQWLTQLETPELTQEGRDIILSDAF